MAMLRAVERRSNASSENDALKGFTTSARETPSGRKGPMRWEGRIQMGFCINDNNQLVAGDALPTLSVTFRGARPQPTAHELERWLDVVVLRGTPNAGTSTNIDPQDARISIKHSSNASCSSSSEWSKGYDGEAVRRKRIPVPPIPGQCISIHEVELGNMEKAGYFIIQASVSARRHTNSQAQLLQMPLIEGPRLQFVVRPNIAVVGQCKIKLLRPPRDANQQQPHQHQPSRERVDGDMPLDVHAGDPINLQVLTRDRFCNATANQAATCVTAEIALLEPAGRTHLDEEETREQQQEVSARYMGDGIHNAEFVIKRAGRYAVKALVGGMAIAPDNGVRELTIRVYHASMLPASCKCIAMPQDAVDPRAIAAALDRERIKRTRKASATDGDITFGADDLLSERTPACTPEHSIGLLKLTTYDSFGNLCDNGGSRFKATLRATTSWTESTESVATRPDGEAWIDDGDAGVYAVRFRGLAGHYLLHVNTEQGELCGGMPYPVLILPPVGGPATARPHGPGIRNAIAGQWSCFLLRPSEFVGCPPGPSDISRSLFEQLTIAILRRGESPPWPWTGPPCSRALETTNETTLNLAVERLDHSSMPRGITLPRGGDRSGLVQMPVSMDEHIYAAQVLPPPGVLLPPHGIIEKHYGSQLAMVSRDIGDHQRSQGELANSSPPQVEPGGHLVRMRVKASGLYDVYVRYGRLELDGSPFALQVAPSTISRSCCEVIGLAEGQGEVAAGEAISGAILLRDDCGNAIVAGLGAPKVCIRLRIDPTIPSLCPSGIEENGRLPASVVMDAEAVDLLRSATNKSIGGQCLPGRLGAQFTFTLRVAGWYQVVVQLLYGETTRSSVCCYPIMVRPQKPDPPMCRFIKMPDFDDQLPAGSRFHMLMLLRDSLGNACASGGHAVHCTVHSPGEPAHMARSIPFEPGHVPQRGLIVWDRRNGTYEVGFTPGPVGHHVLSLSVVEGKTMVLIGTKPFKYDVKPGIPDPDNCLARGEGTRLATSGVPSYLIVEARDSAGNLVSEHPLAVRVFVSPAGNHQRTVDVRSMKNGRYKVTYTVPASGIYMLSVLVGLDGKGRLTQRHARGSPFHLTVQAGTKEKPNKGGESPRRAQSARSAPVSSDRRALSARGGSSPRGRRPMPPDMNTPGG